MRTAYNGITLESHSELEKLAYDNQKSVLVRGIPNCSDRAATQLLGTDVHSGHGHRNAGSCDDNACHPCSDDPSGDGISLREERFAKTGHHQRSDLDACEFVGHRDGDCHGIHTCCAVLSRDCSRPQPIFRVLWTTWTILAAANAGDPILKLDAVWHALSAA